MCLNLVKMQAKAGSMDFKLTRVVCIFFLLVYDQILFHLE